MEKNNEGYPDPTAAEAIRRVVRDQKHRKRMGYMPIVYICSPFAGDTDTNIRAARRYCRFAALEGYIPFAAHLLYPQFLKDEDGKERELGTFFGNVFMDKCSEVWIFGRYLSPGMKEEKKRALRKGYTIRYFTEDCIEVTDAQEEGGYGTV